MKMLKSSEIRNQFIEFFKSKDHKHVASAPVIPYGDPTLLFTNAGMNQFKDVFLGTGNRDYSRAVDTQKCIRVSGKHNDLEEVGVDTYHHTFFEMLGNWSFRDYYKEEAIAWAWELLTEVWKLPKDRLFATVYKDDDEAFEFWTKHLPQDRILRCGEKDNFWEMGDTGPCGPCSEIHFDGTADKSGKEFVNADNPQVIEIWNLVFIQYNRNESGDLEPLSGTYVDTGMGFERIVRVLQGKSSNYDTDIFMPLIDKISSLSKVEYQHSEALKTDIAMRVMADHIRTLSFSIADGAIPGNDGRGYVLRRILRRAARFSRDLGFRQPVLFELVDVLCATMGDFFPEIVENKDIIKKIVKAEEESFLQTLETGLIKFEEIVAKSNEQISGDDAFLLFDSFGFPLDLTQLIAREKGLSVNTEQFEKNMQQQKERSRSSRKNVNQQAESQTYDFVSEFVGYEVMEATSKVLFAEGNVLILDKTPFYAESGGQVSDTGTITIDNSDYEVKDVKKSGSAILHIVTKDLPADLTSKTAVAQIDKHRRKSIMRNHSATHLLHEALKRVLGSHIQQQGSLVAPDYLRFDYNHFEKASKEQLRLIEDIANSKILEAHKVETNIMSLEEAQNKEGLKMYFGDKYGEVVRAVTMDSSFSQELCGGTHVSNTAEIGFVKITSESSIASGIRRIEAITGEAIPKLISDLEKALEAEKYKETALQHQIKKLEKEISSLKVAELSAGIGDLASDFKEVKGIKLVAKQIEAENIDQLRDLGDELRKGLKNSGIGLLATVIEDKAQLVCVATDDVKDKYPAGKIIGLAAKFIGGGGGGKPHLATAGGKEIEKLGELLNSEIVSIVESF
jgi:alanyl-tRNA synthetase